MSHVEHQAMCITSWNSDILLECREKFIGAEISVTPFFDALFNGYSTFFVIPCGSKAGWGESKKHLGQIEKAIDIINSYGGVDEGQQYNSIEYSIAIYGQHSG